MAFGLPTRTAAESGPYLDPTSVLEKSGPYLEPDSILP